MPMIKASAPGGIIFGLNVALFFSALKATNWSPPSLVAPAATSCAVGTQPTSLSVALQARTCVCTSLIRSCGCTCSS